MAQCPELSTIVKICHNLSNIVQICPVPLCKMSYREKRPFSGPFCRPWVYIPERVSRPVAAPLGPFNGILRFLKAVFRSQNADFCQGLGQLGLAGQAEKSVTVPAIADRASSKNSRIQVFRQVYPPGTQLSFILYSTTCDLQIRGTAQPCPHSRLQLLPAAGHIIALSFIVIHFQM